MSEMRRTVVLTGLFATMLVACENKTPVGPGTVTVTQTTSSTTTIPTTTTSIAPATRAIFTVSPNPASVAQQVHVDGSGSMALPGRSLISYAWNYGDGTMKSGVTSQHDYDAPGTYTIVLTVTDDAGQKATASQPVTVGGTAATITAPVTAAVVRFVALAAPPSNRSVAADMTLFFELVHRPRGLDVWRAAGIASAANRIGVSRDVLQPDQFGRFVLTTLGSSG